MLQKSLPLGGVLLLVNWICQELLLLRQTKHVKLVTALTPCEEEQTTLEQNTSGGFMEHFCQH